MNETNEFIKIKIIEQVNPNLGLNSSTKDLFKKLNNSTAQNIEIDFTDVVFMSRSFTQEYVSKNKTNKNIKEINIPEDVAPMFKIEL
ncbi:hypothetical protein ALNOE001_20240 [Candidatus Methanobinarius endosymbioticus]|uniref:DUF4325 domain-containing protein n=1 Tax=Candidatus Methanobinarius endosymbioticus TaxID=2006182 RepID=A0A366M9M1_9EURY|nr:hypothetical protein ALNOE001_20240 [Candidatus Methanobinarius endosymbioticus]